MKALLLSPPAINNIRIVREGRCMQRQEAWGTSWAPLTLAITAAVLRNEGFEVRLKDCPNDGINIEQLKNEIQAYRPDFIAVNTSTPSITGDLKIAGIAGKIDRKIKTIFFGIHVTALPEETFRENTDVEFIVDGEPEYTIRDFALALKKNITLSSVEGLIYKREGKIVRNKKRPFIENLDELPYPAWDLVNINGYRLPITNRPFLLTLTARGCPYPCEFCAAQTLYGKKPRLRSWQKIVSEMKYVKEHYGVNDFLFWSENAISDRQHMYDISRGLCETLPGVRWVCNGRADIIDEELLKVMKESGCWMIGYGIEAGTRRVLDLMDKHITIGDIERAVRLTKEAGLEVTGHVMVGFPGETRADILETIKLVKRLGLDYVQPYCAVPFPGSPLYKKAKDAGWIKTADWSKFEQNFSVLSTPFLSAKEAMSLRSKLIRDFYFDPRNIIKTLCKVKSPRQALFLVSAAWRFFIVWAKG